MNAFRRIQTSIEMSIDQFLDRIENHEATATHALRCLTEAAGKGRYHLKRLQQEADAKRRRLEALPGEKALWEDRAKRVHSTDPARAVECLRYIQSLEQEEGRLTGQLDRVEGSIRQLQTEMSKIDSRIADVRQKTHELAAREAQAHARGAVCSARSTEAVEEIFGRWEGRLASLECSVPSDASDDFASRFEKEENEARLQARLNELVSRKQ